MNKKDKDLINRFVDLLKEVERVEGAVLYGSLARGDYDRRSDIDIMVIIDDKKPMKRLSRITKIITDLRPHREIQCVLTNLRDKDEEFYKNVFKDGKVLFGKFVLTPEKASLRPFIMISYDLGKVPPSKKVKIAHRIHGHKSVKKVKGKTYRYEYKGLKDRYDATFIGKGVIILKKMDADDFISELKKLKIKYKSYDIWM
jgi:predicted nucleotidyltransferase